MAIDLDGFEPEVKVAFRAVVDRVKRAQKRTVVDFWHVGQALNELRGIVRGMPGVKWYEVYGKSGLGYSQTTQQRYRELATMYDTAEEAGQYTSVNKAIRAKGKNPTVCPGWSPKGSDEERAPGCSGKKKPQYRFCIPCSKAWETDEKADAKTRRTERRHKKEQLDAALDNTVTAALERQLKEAYRQITAKEKTIGLLQEELLECHERLQMVEQRFIPMDQFSPTVDEMDWPEVTA